MILYYYVYDQRTRAVNNETRITEKSKRNKINNCAECFNIIRSKHKYYIILNTMCIVYKNYKIYYGVGIKYHGSNENVLVTVTTTVCRCIYI